MPNLKNVVKVTEEQFNQLKNGQSVGGHTYDPTNNLYLVDSEDDNVHETVLWTNSSPTSTFSPKTVYVEDLTQYDYIKIGYKIHISNDYGIMYKQFKASNLSSSNSRVTLDCLNLGDSQVRVSREVTLKNTSIYFNTGYLYYSQGYTSNNDFCIPVEIIGVKTGKVTQTEGKDVLYRLDIRIQMMTNSSSIWGEIYATTFITKSVLDSRNPSTFTSDRILGDNVMYTGYDLAEFLRVLFPSAYYNEIVPAIGSGYCQSDIARPLYCFVSAQEDTSDPNSIKVISNNGWATFSATGTSSYPRANIAIKCSRVAG